MQYSYIISGVTSRTNGYVSYSSNNDYCLSDRAYKQSSPCSCCAFPFNGVPSNPRFFLGFSQSSLIYLPAYRRLALASGDRFSQFSQLSSCDFDRSCRQVSCSAMNCCQCSCSSRISCTVQGRRSCGGCNYVPVCCGRCYAVKESCCCSSGVGRRGAERKLKCLGWEEKSERCDSSTDEATEELLSLLSEKDDKDVVRRKEKVVFKGVREVKRGRGESKRRGKYEESNRLERDSRGMVKSVKKSSEEDYGSLGRKKSSSRYESRKLRKDRSNCSSYHSVVSSAESGESDVDVHVKHEKFSNGSSRRNKKESRSFQEDVSVKKVIKQTEMNKDDAARYREVLRKQDAATQTTMVDVGSDLSVINEQRKKIQKEESKIESLNRKNEAEAAFVSQKWRDDSVSKYSVDDTREQHSQMGSRITQHDSSSIKSQQLMEMERASSSKTPSRGREENLVVSVNSFEGERDGQSQTGRIIGQSESRRNWQQPSTMFGSHDTGVRNTLTPRMHFESTSKNEGRRSGRTLHREEELDFQTDQQVGYETKSTEESVDPSSIAEVSNNDAVIMSETKAFGRRMSSQEETSGPRVYGMSEKRNSDIRTSTTQMLSESSWRNRHETSEVLRSSFHDIEDQSKTNQSPVWEQSSTKDSQDETNIPRTRVSNPEIVGVSQKYYKRRTSPREEISASQVQDMEETQRETEQRNKQVELSKEFDKRTGVSSIWRTSVNTASSSQQLNPTQQASGIQTNEFKESEKNLPVMVTPPQPQTIGVPPQYTLFQPKSTSETTGEVFFEMPVSGSSTSVTQEIMQFSPDNLNGGDSKDGIDENQSMIPYYEDRLGSARRSEECSSQFVRELVENLSHEVSTSELPDKDMLPETTSSSRDAEHSQQSLNQATTEILHTQVDDTKRSSSRSAARGPSDEIWDVAGSFSEEPGMTEAPSEGNSTTKNAIRKSGRSFWNIIGDIVKLRWGTDSETHISTKKSGGKSSSNESGGSEAWFSSHETDEKVDENAKKGRKNMPKVHGASDQHSLAKPGMLSLKGASEEAISKNQILRTDSDAVSSLDSQEGGSASKSFTSGTSRNLIEGDSQKMLPDTTTSSSSSLLPSRHLTRSPAVKGEIPESGNVSVSGSDIQQMEQPVQETQTDAIGTEMKDGELKRRKFQRKKQVEQESFTSGSSRNLNQGDSQKMLPDTTTASSSSLLPSRHLIRSPAVKGETPESGNVSISGSEILQMEQPVQETQTDTIGTEMKDGELKRRKLQRKKQVEQESFEDWEEAYRLESEQRKVDEMFMKEALLEAKSAADTWEVPVGAVLVQDGKVIARGCNLVENLRDSTAHAEIICIREASKTLRTWRLAETTLYVTLEPCAMCAGAILQSRIDTVVYGAPNKLLGADGSWVRLFPGESEGGSSASTSQSAGPVHPFHPKITIRRGVLATECADVMQQFFQLRRKKKRSNSPPTPSSPVSNHPPKFLSKLHDIFHIMYCL